MTSLTSAWLCVALLSIFAVDLSFSDKNFITAESGEDVTMTCKVPKGKTIRAVKWSRTDMRDEYVLLYRDEQLDPEKQHPSFKNRVDLQDRQMKDGDVSLILKDVTINDDGSYKCRVFVGESSSWEIMGTVNMSVGLPGQPEGRSFPVIVAIAVVLLLLVAALVFFIYIRKRRQPRY